MDMEQEMDKLQNENATLRAELRFENNGRLNAEAQCGKLQAELDLLRAERDALQAWKDAVPVLEIDIVATDGIVMREWENKSAIIIEWLDVVRCRHEYLSDADRKAAMQRVLDGAP